MKKDIFATLKNYTKGYHDHSSKEEIKIYNAKVKELTDRIQADLEHAPEIIAEEFAKCEVLKYREAFTHGTTYTAKYQATWKAVDNVTNALMDSRPLA